jgi:hypothetical protein
MKQHEPKKCLVPECEKKAFSRGLCKTHYEQAMRLVREEPGLEERLIANGRILAPFAHCASRTDFFDV